MVVTGGGSGSGNAKSTVNGPVPGCAGAGRAAGTDVPGRLRGLPEVLVVRQAREAEGAAGLVQCHSSWSSSWAVQSIVTVLMARTLTAGHRQNAVAPAHRARADTGSGLVRRP